MNSNTRYVYVGPGDGQGKKHQVTMIADGVVTTWSELFPNANETQIAGHSWMGSLAEFKLHFREDKS